MSRPYRTNGNAGLVPVTQAHRELAVEYLAIRGWRAIALTERVFGYMSPGTWRSCLHLLHRLGATYDRKTCLWSLPAKAVRP